MSSSFQSEGITFTSLQERVGDLQERLEGGINELQEEEEEEETVATQTFPPSPPAGTSGAPVQALAGEV